MEENINKIESPAPQVEPQDDGIDFKEIALRLWVKRKFILWVFGCFVALGFIAAIAQTPKYTANCTFVPMSSSTRSSSSSLSSLAALAGINLGDMSASADLSPLIYPQLMDNVELKKELMRVPLHFKRYEEPVSLYDLSTDPKYRRFTFATIKKYTIGLPFTILGAIRGQKELEVSSESGVTDGESIPYLTLHERNVAKALSKMVNVSVDKKEGYLTVTSTMNEPLAAAELCQATFEILQKYIAEFKLTHAKANYGYVKERYEDVKQEYEEKQLALARFSDANKGMLSATAQIEKDKLNADFNVAYAVFTEMSKQLIQVEMKVKEDVPVLSSVKPVSVPAQKSNSRSKTLMTWSFLGFVLGCGLVVLFDWCKKQNIRWPFKWPRKWLKKCFKNLPEEWN